MTTREQLQQERQLAAAADLTGKQLEKIRRLQAQVARLEKRLAKCQEQLAQATSGEAAND